MTQHRDPGHSLFSSLPWATNPRLSPRGSVSPCPPSTGAQTSDCKHNFVHWLFKRVSASWAISPWWTETLLFFSRPSFRSQLFCGFLSPFLCFTLGILAWCLDPTFLGGEPPKAAEIYLQNFSCHPRNPSQPSHASALPTSLNVVV